MYKVRKKGTYGSVRIIYFSLVDWNYVLQFMSNNKRIHDLRNVEILRLDYCSEP